MLQTTAYSNIVLYFETYFGEEGLWKKFLLGPAYRIVKTSHREKEIFNNRYKMFFLADGGLSVVWNELENKKKKNLNSNTKYGCFVDKLFHIISCLVIVQLRVSLLLVPILSFIYFISCYFVLLYYLYFLFIC